METAYVNNEATGHRFNVQSRRYHAPGPIFFKEAKRRFDSV